MSQLRWTLLILGMVFIAALTWWERRRPRQAFAPRLRDVGLSHADLPHTDAHRTASSEPAGGGEPWIGETGLSDVGSSDVQGESSTPGPLEELPTLVIPDEDARHALEAAWSEQPVEPKLIDPEARAAEEAAEEAALEALEPIEATEPEPETPSEPLCVQEPTQAVAASEPPSASVSAPASAPEPEIPGAEGVGAVRVVEPPFGCDGSPPVAPIVEWPPEDSRRILALRLVSRPPARFPGRTLRLALAAEGFVLGRFSIYHKPDEANRAVLSAASLTRPGTFDLETMDSQRYVGLNLFVVLPGPKRPAQAFEELLAAARNLNERLEGALQDERGGPLTQLRVNGIRESLRVEATIVPAAAAHEA